MKVNDNTIDRTLIRKIQRSQLYLLNAFRDFCMEHNLHFLLDFGTLIGAVRHNGFVPWDDDVDIAMLRDEYERFLKFSRTWNHPDVFVQWYETDPEFVHSFTRLRLNGSEAVQEDWQYLNCHHGIFIDIFPYDTIPEDESLRKQHEKDIEALQNKKLDLVTKRLVTPELMYALNYEQTQLITKYNNERTDDSFVSHMTQGLSCGYYDYRKRVKDMKAYHLHPFEGEMMPIMDKYAPTLNNTYGDFMTYPCEEERKPHHGVVHLKFREDILK